MHEHDFQVQSERIRGSIRGEQVKQLQYDFQSEQERTKQSLNRVNTEKQKTLETKEDTGLARLKVEGKRKDAVLLRHQNTRKNIDAAHLNKENPLVQKTLDLKYQNLELGYSEAKKHLENKRELLKQQGLIG
jgi:hypothetical protein